MSNRNSGVQVEDNIHDGDLISAAKKLDGTILEKSKNNLEEYITDPVGQMKQSPSKSTSMSISGSLDGQRKAGLQGIVPPTTPSSHLSQTPVIKETSSVTLTRASAYDPKLVLEKYPPTEALIQDESMIETIEKFNLLEELMVISPTDVYHSGKFKAPSVSGEVMILPSEQFLSRVCAYYFSEIPAAADVGKCFKVLAYLVLKVAKIDVEVPQPISDAYELLVNEFGIGNFMKVAAKVLLNLKQITNEKGYDYITPDNAQSTYDLYREGPIGEVTIAVDLIDLALDGTLWELKEIPKVIGMFDYVALYVNRLAKGDKCLLSASVYMLKCVVPDEVHTKSARVDCGGDNDEETDNKEGENTAAVTEKKDAETGPKRKDIAVSVRKSGKKSVGGQGLFRKVKNTVETVQEQDDKKLFVFSASSRGEGSASEKPGIYGVHNLFIPPTVSISGENKTRPNDEILDMAHDGRGDGRDTTAFRTNALDLSAINQSISDIMMTQVEMSEEMGKMSLSLASVDEVREGIKLLALAFTEFSKGVNETLSLILTTMNSRDLQNRNEINRTILDPPTEEVARIRAPEKVSKREYKKPSLSSGLGGPNDDKKDSIIRRLTHFNAQQDLDAFAKEIKDFCANTAAASMTNSLTGSQIGMEKIRKILLGRIKAV